MIRQEIVIDLDGTFTLPRIGEFEGFLTPLQPALVSIGLVPIIGWYFYHLRPNKAMVEWLKESSSKYWITILTGRCSAFEYITCRWLVENGIPFDSLVFTPLGEKDIDFKVDYARKHESRIALMVDNMRHIRDGVAEIIGDRSILWKDLIRPPAVL
jgi:hypothetical protein